MTGILAISLLLLSVGTSSTAPPDYSNLGQRLTRHTLYRYSADLKEVKRRKVLRVLTRNNSSSYFIARGGQRGFQFELARAFAKHLDVRLAIVVPSSRSKLITALLSGEGDMIAAGMSVTPARAELVHFTQPVLSSARVVATHPNIIKRLETLEDLVQFRIHLSFRSTTYRDAIALEKRLGVPLLLADVTDGVEMEEMMRRVGNGTYEATIVDQDLLELERANGTPLEARISVSEKLPKGWAVHPGAPALHEAAEAFIRRSQKTGLIRILYAKYYRPSSGQARRAREMEYRADQEGGGISPFDELFKKAGKETNLDWRLLAALAYSESRFDTKARSPWGAVGLMQVLPSTAGDLGVKNLEDPEENVMAGARYLRRLTKRFEGVSPRQKIRFALASYNAGLGHIRDARRLAETTGRDKNRWFGNVAEALLLKMDRRWHERTRYGYCRALETINYVSRIQSRYDVYVRHVPLNGE